MLESSRSVVDESGYVGARYCGIVAPSARAWRESEAPAERRFCTRRGLVVKVQVWLRFMWLIPVAKMSCRTSCAASLRPRFLCSAEEMNLTRDFPKIWEDKYVP